MLGMWRPENRRISVPAALRGPRVTLNVSGVVWSVMLVPSCVGVEEIRVSMAVFDAGLQRGMVFSSPGLTPFVVHGVGEGSYEYLQSQQANSLLTTEIASSVGQGSEYPFNWP